MNDPGNGQIAQVVIHDDDTTPFEFVIGLLRNVFGKSEAEAKAIALKTGKKGEASCGSYPAAVADALLSAARQECDTSGYPLKLEKRSLSADGQPVCDFCGRGAQVFYRGRNAYICDACILLGAEHLSEISKTRQFKFAFQAINWHFAGIERDHIVSSRREFPAHMRADVQLTIDKVLAASTLRFFGIYEEHRYETLTFAALLKDNQYARLLAPPQYHDIDIGNAEPVKCLENGLWLCRQDELRFVVVLSVHREVGEESGYRIEITVPAGESGSNFVRQCFAALEEAVNASKSYRGKVLSLEAKNPYSGTSKGLTVHRLATVAKTDLILPEATVRLLDRNVLDFAANRDRLRQLGQSTKKGILLYGPPGTGKTHTIRYLAGSLAGHTTLIITAQQVAFLRTYMNLAHLLQPSLVVIEDVDLIARAREEMDGPCQESMLNQLLNEMDGLKESADIIFVLTTNHPEQLETALSGRPGRIDQAIEIGLPAEAEREKLVRLYGRGLDLRQDVVAAAVRRTEGVSAAFIKEMMRRTAQASITRGRDGQASLADIETALDDMLFAGGQINSTLLGAAAVGRPNPNLQ